MTAQELLDKLTELNTYGYDLNHIDIKTAIALNGQGEYFDGIFTTSYSSYSKKLDINGISHERQQLILLGEL
jgi:hypothetical protein